MEKKDIYNDDFYRNRDSKTKNSAKRIGSIINEQYAFKSAVDIGCGVGTWLREFGELGARDVLGIDGSWVNKDFLVIDKDRFVPQDLTQKIQANRRFDIAISLEVAEHLPENRAHGFISDLCNLSDVVLFSAATKKQGGDAHINEQRASYWKSIFRENGYSIFDVVRPIIWNDIDIPVWYRQNIFVYVNSNNKAASAIFEAMRQNQECVIDMIHPQLYEEKIVDYEYRLHEAQAELDKFRHEMSLPLHRKFYNWLRKGLTKK